MSTCVNDRVTCLQLMSNLQGTCVDVCQWSHIVPTTYSQRSRMCEPYGEYVVKFSACLKFHDVRDVPRNMTAYFIVFQRTLNVYTTYPYRIWRVPAWFGKFFIGRHTLAKSSRCDCVVDTFNFQAVMIWIGERQLFNRLRHEFVGDTCSVLCLS